MKPSSWIAPLLALMSSVACSANDTATPAATGGASSGNRGGSTSTGGQASSTGGQTSSTGGIPGVIGLGGSTGTVGGEENCGQFVFKQGREPADILLVLDRSESMEDVPDGDPAGSPSKWNLVVPALTEVINATSAGVAWGMKSYPEGEGSACIAGSVTERIDVPVADSNAAAVTTGIMNTTPKGNGTPTGDAVKQAVIYMKTLTSTHQKFLLLATDGEPSCANNAQNTTQARTYAVQAVADALAAGFPTYVVGVATTKDTASAALNSMAVAGGKALDDGNPLALRYYRASTKQVLVDAMTAITGEANNTCVFALNPPPPSPEWIGVKLAGAKIERDPSKANGWEYTAADFSQLEVFGALCDTIKAAASSQVDITYGCASNPPR